MMKICILLFACAALATATDVWRKYYKPEHCMPKSCEGKVLSLCKYMSLHPGPQCPKVLKFQLSENEKQRILDLHNKLRAKVASGNEARGSPGPQFAGNIGPLKWDDTLTRYAQAWASQCVYDHDECRDLENVSVGQNVARSWSSDPNYVTVESMVNGWYNEVDLFNKYHAKKYVFSLDIGHYSQIVAGRTTAIGCGIVQFVEKGLYVTHLVCNYAPGGNLPGAPLYEIYG